MHLIWIAPLLAGAAAVIALAWVGLRVALEAHELHNDIRSLSQLRPALMELRRLAEQTHGTATTLRHP